MNIVSIVGARPQFIKASVVSRAIEEVNKENPGDSVKEVLVHTGQHYDKNMSRVFFDELDIREPNYNLGIGSGSHGVQTGRMVEAVEGVLLKESPDWVIVYGDTNSTLAGALAAKKLGIRVAHVEAGLRSFNMKMPEEVNRIIADRISDLLFCPTTTAVTNLQNEGFKKIYNDGRLIEDNVKNISILPVVINIGDVMYDAAIYFKGLAREKSRIVHTLKLRKKRYVLATVHRTENTDNGIRLKEIINGLIRIAEELPVVFSIHPRTREAVKREGLEPILKTCRSLYLIPPLSYLDMISLEQAAGIIITDSGGVQKEAFFYGIPCITVRDETEWIETVGAGCNILAGADRDKIIEAFKGVGKNKRVERKNFYGKGMAGKHIVACLKAV